MESVVEKCEATIQRHGMLPRRGCLVLAISGGPDSLALLHVMRDIRERGRPHLALHVGHLHHGMRGAAADEDARFVESEAARLGAGCTVERADVPRLARERRLGIEVAGRDARYRFLTRLAKSLGAARIAFGHQANDQMETVLMRAIHGAGPRGMGGIPYVRDVEDAPGIRIVRPLLDCSRSEIERFLRARGLHPRTDATNLSLKHLRNLLRARVIPKMKRQWGRRLTSDLCSLAALAQRLQARSDAMCAALQSQHPVRVATEYVETEADWLRQAPPAILAELVQRWMKESRLWRKTLSAQEYERIASLIERGRGRVALSGPALAWLWRGLFILCPPRRSRESEYSVPLAVPGATRIEPLNGRIEAQVLRAGKELIARKRSTRDGFEEFLDMGAIQLPLFARFPRPGDRVRLLGAPGSRKLQDIFTDLHVPPWLRARTLIITMRDHPVWIVGLRIADSVKLTDSTRKVLRLRFLSRA